MIWWILYSPPCQGSFAWHPDFAVYPTWCLLFAYTDKSDARLYQSFKVGYFGEVLNEFTMLWSCEALTVLESGRNPVRQLDSHQPRFCLQLLPATTTCLTARQVACRQLLYTSLDSIYNQIDCFYPTEDIHRLYEYTSKCVIVRQSSRDENVETTS